MYAAGSAAVRQAGVQQGATAAGRACEADPATSSTCTCRQSVFPHTAMQAAPLFDKLVFSKVKQRLGGRVKLILTGGAPLARHVEDFLKVTMCCPVVQGYGLTETCAASFIGIPDQIVRRLSHMFSNAFPHVGIGKPVMLPDHACFGCVLYPCKHMVQVVNIFAAPQCCADCCWRSLAGMLSSCCCPRVSAHA